MHYISSNNSIEFTISCAYTVVDLHLWASGLIRRLLLPIAVAAVSRGIK